MAQLRWQRSDLPDPQLRLLDTARRRVGRGEYRGLEFLEVEARSIINKVPTPGGLPFGFTVNPYRGCSHACTYCFARPTHDYLGLGIGQDFDTRIVVKVNAVERVRHETSPARWAGELIAMGTNTDPYQPAEGRYRLTRGIVEVLGERRNPFSILTKSPLVLRDLDVLTAASEHTEIGVDFSIGTLDESVWRSTEPGTPHPRRRMDAVARLNAAGIPSGVLMGPVLPGLSDHPDQLDAVVAAAIDAGAVSIGTVLLHLGKGVKEHYLDHLATSRPDLATDLAERYRGRKYPPQEEQRNLSALVTELIARHGGIRWRRRRREPEPDLPRRAPADQMTLQID